MLATMEAATVWGVEAFPVRVEVDVSAGDHKISLVGLPDAAVRESLDRVKPALLNSGFRFPFEVLTINLSPADLKKEGPSFDLPIALGILGASGQLRNEDLRSLWIVGELALNGEVRPVRGTLSVAISARRHGKKRLIVPAANAPEASMVSGIEIIPIRTLREAVDYIEGTASVNPAPGNALNHSEEGIEMDFDFSEVKGQEATKRAIEVAVAGGHNLLMTGVQGTGKSMIAKRIPTIFPPLTMEEALETTRIHSVCGLLTPDRPMVQHRPFRAPHHTISDIGLIGGSANPSPGEVSLAHNGVLFLDELPEFKRNTLEVMRQPLEDGHVTISRAAGTVTFPARFMLVAAMNPTPSGSFDGRCSEREIQRYLNKISGPLLDRIDIQIEVPPVKHEFLFQTVPAESSKVIRSRVIKARQVQQRRFSGKKRKIHCNAQMGSKEIREFCVLQESSLEMLRMAMEQMHLSARAYDRILKVARTIADLAGNESISDDDLCEAVQFRSLDRQKWG